MKMLSAILATMVFLLTFSACVSENSQYVQQKGGKIHSKTFTGPITGDTIKYNIYLPRGYHDSNREYPVIYHLHGLGEDEFAGNECLVNSLQRATDNDIASPMIIVFPNGLKNSLYADAKDGHKPAETHIIRELIPHVDATYRTLQSREQRIISGMSMGGFGAVQFAIKFPQLFSACVSFDAGHLGWEQFQIDFPTIAKEIFGDDEKYFNRHAPWLLAEKNIDMIKDKVGFRLIVGPSKEYNEKLRDLLQGLKIEVDYVETEQEHELEVLLAADSKGIFTFITEHTGPASNKTQEWVKDIKGTIATHDFIGPISHITVPYTIYLPSGYKSSKTRYPVIYHLHGHDCGQYEGNRPLVEALESAIDDGIVGPMIVVFPDGHGDARWADGKDGKKPAETNVIRELIPHIDANYRTLASRDYRVIEGMSMGGGGAIAYAVKFPELFSVCIGYDGSIPTWEQILTRSSANEQFAGDENYFNSYSAWHNLDKNKDIIRGQVGFRMVVGPLKRYNEPFLDQLEELDIECDYVQTDCEHNIYCLIRETSKETFAFLAAHMGSAAVSPGGHNSNR
jgi:enterochelin esterase-like enzyme